LTVIFREKTVTKGKDLMSRDCRIRIHLEKLVDARLLRKKFFQCYIESGTGVHKNPLLHPVLNRLNSVLILTPHVSKIHFDISLTPTIS
jgi:hypothetical protein